MYEELIKDLQYCSDNGDCGYCKYDAYSCECLDHIEKASAEALEDMNRRLDAAMKDIPRFCRTCANKEQKWLSDGPMDDLCKTCLSNINRCNWEWCGPKEGT